MTATSDLGRLERRVDRLRALVGRMYQTLYASRTRRKGTYGVKAAEVQSRLFRLSKGLPRLYKVASLASRLEAGKRVVALDNQQYQLLMQLLMRQKPFRSRG